MGRRMERREEGGSELAIFPTRRRATPAQSESEYSWGAGLVGTVFPGFALALSLSK